MTIRIRRSLKGCLLLALFVGLIGAQGNGGCRQMAMKIWADLQQQIDDNQEQTDSQQQQIDQLTGAVCELFELTGDPTHSELCASDQQDDDPGNGSGGCQCEFGCDSNGMCNPPF